MKTSALARLTALSALIAVLPIHAEELATSKAVFAYVSPPSLFPVEGSFTVIPDAPGYKPVPAYASPGGKLVGEVITEQRICSEPCDGVRDTFLQPLKGKRVALEQGEWSYDTKGLITYRPPITREDQTWSRIESPKGAFWVAVPAENIHTYESLATSVGDFDEICTEPSQCSPVTVSMQRDLAAVRAGAYELSGPNSDAYEIVDRVTQKGTRFYKVRRIQTGPGPVLTIPEEGYVPVRKRNGAHTGNVYPKGC